MPEITYNLFMGDINEDSAIFGVITGFPQAGRQFIKGFEAGIVWGQLWSSKNPVEVIIDRSNLEGIKRIAKHFDCTLETKKHPASEALFITITKTGPERAPHQFEVGACAGPLKLPTF
jgi:hypothetical protein